MATTIIASKCTQHPQAPTGLRGESYVLSNSVPLQGNRPQETQAGSALWVGKRCRFSVSEKFLCTWLEQVYVLGPTPPKQTKHTPNSPNAFTKMLSA